MALLAIWLLCPCQVGQKYELENEDDLKDKMDFVKFVEVAPGLGMLGQVPVWSGYQYVAEYGQYVGEYVLGTSMWVSMARVYWGRYQYVGEYGLGTSIG